MVGHKAVAAVLCAALPLHHVVHFINIAQFILVSSSAQVGCYQMETVINSFDCKAHTVGYT